MYTTALEYHIAVLQGLQKVAAYTDDMFAPEEIDLHLTKQQNRVVEEIVNKSFADLQVGLDYIRPLIVKNKSLQVIIPQTTESIYERDMVYTVLPPDYLYLVNDRSGVVTSTTASYCNDMSSFKNNSTYQDSIVEYVAHTPMITALATQTPYFYKFKVIVTVSGTPVEYIVPTALWNIQSSKSGFVISNYIMESLVVPDVKIYWEKYRNLYYPNEFIFVTLSSSITNVTLSCQKSSVDASSGGSSTGNFINAGTYKTTNYSAISGYNLAYAGNILTEIDEIYSQNTNSFYLSASQSPKSTLSQQYLMVFEGKSFLVSNLVIDYIRIPRQISLSLNQISELGGNGPGIIVDRTVEYLKLAIENPAYQAVLNDNKVRDQI